MSEPGFESATMTPPVPSRLNGSVFFRLIKRAKVNEAAQAEADARKEKLKRGKLFEQISKDFGFRYSPDRATLENFRATLPAQKEVKRRMEEISKSLPAMVESGRGIIWFGGVGTGKDHLQAAVLYEAARLGISCRRLNGQDFFGTIRDRMSDGQKEEEIIRKFTEPQILAISDPIPPANELSAFRLEILYRLVNRRYEAMRPTWITMNALSIEECENFLGSQVWDRLQESGELVPCLWASHREKNRKRIHVARTEPA
jgi:DNA replication protein DnaC